jgi:hypothetical protein
MLKKKSNEKVIILPQKRLSYIFPSGRWSEIYAEKVGHLHSDPFILEHDFVFLCRGKIGLDELFFKSYGMLVGLPNEGEIELSDEEKLGGKKSKKYIII